MNRNATAHLARLEPTKNCTYSQFSLYAVAGTEMIVTALISVARKDRHAAHHGTLRRARKKASGSCWGGGGPRSGAAGARAMVAGGGGRGLPAPPLVSVTRRAWSRPGAVGQRGAPPGSGAPLGAATMRRSRGLPDAR